MIMMTMIMMMTMKRRQRMIMMRRGEDGREGGEVLREGRRSGG